MTDVSGLYIHIPFCATKCPYCDFFSVQGTVAAAEKWCACLQREMLLYRRRFPRFDTLYLGGGTPTVLGRGMLGRIMRAAEEHFVFVRGTEVTIEANPGDISADLLRLLLDLGVNRISLGVQSCDDRALKFLGRRHSSSEAQRAVRLVRKAGCANLSIDLIYGIPGQTRQGWFDTLQGALAWQPEHISCYQLTLKRGTPLWHARETGSMEFPDEAEQAQLYLITAEQLEKHGYVHYETSSFARGVENRARHNSKYWQRAPYLGLGPAAHSFCEDTRWWNVASIEAYDRMLRGGRAPVEQQERLSQGQRRLEELMLAFRTRDGLDLKALQQNERHAGILRRLSALRLVDVTKNRVQPTTRGLLVADRLPLLFA